MASEFVEYEESVKRIAKPRNVLGKHWLSCRKR